MERFTYTRTGQALKYRLLTLGVLAGADLAGWVIAIFLLPPPWGLGVGLGGLAITAVVYWFVMAPLRTAHVLDGERLLLQMGRQRVAVRRQDIRTVAPLKTPLSRRLDVGISYRSQTDTLYVLADHRRLVALTLARPYELKVPGQGLCQFTRVVLSLDEPDRFCAVLAGPGSAAEPVVVPPPAEAQPAAPATRTLPPAAPASTTTPAGARVPPAIPSGPPAPPAYPAAPAADGATPVPSAQREACGGAALRLVGLVKRYGDFTAVRGINLEVRYGEVLAFLGTNGAGKSTTIRMATGLLRPTAGRVLVEGRDLWGEGGPVRRLLGYVPDVPLLHESLTAREFLWLVAGLYDLPEAEGRRRAEQLLAQVGLERWGDYQIRSFSLGMKRKLALAAALVHRPRVLLLDEVTNGLDPRASRAVKDFIRAAAREGAAVLLTTHILAVAEELADRIAIIHAGAIRAVGDLAVLRAAAGRPGAGLEELFLALTDDPPMGVTA